MGRRLSEDELQETLDFCGKLFAPTSPEEHRTAEDILTERFGEQLIDEPDPEIAKLKFLDVHSPIIDPRIIERVVQDQSKSTSNADGIAPDFQSNAKNPTTDLGYGELDMKRILEKVNARRVIHSEHGNGVNIFEEEPLGQLGTGRGWIARLEKGKLGLVRVDT